jgi:hypothetical protein
MIKFSQFPKSTNLSYDNMVLDIVMPNKKIKLLPTSYYKSQDWNEFRLFCHNYSRYGIVTEELINVLKPYIENKKAIEIGAGNGDLGFHLGIPMTDSKMQNNYLIKKIYKSMGQPTIDYPEDVEQLDAISAIRKYQPEVVVASWVTTFGDPTKDHFGCHEFGIKENEILDMVDTYIFYGNLNVHGDKPILKLPHTLISNPGFISRSVYTDLNRLIIWNRTV